MSKTDLFFVSDQHYFHRNILKFTDSNGNRIRNFSCVEEMNETMILRHNEIVKPNSKIYFLGDVCFQSSDHLHRIMPRLNGKKRLILGNHDHYDMEHYARHFEKIMSWRQLKNFDPPFVCCHYPLHPSQIQDHKRGRVCFNVHGHVHQNTVRREDGKPDHRYVNVCVEVRDYRPVHLDELLKEMKGHAR